MSKITIKDVAKKANVSIATVSRALNGSDKVTPETTKKILAACDELGYSPNLMAKSLKSGRTYSIMAVIPYLTLPSIVERLRGLLEALAPSAYDLIPFSVDTPEDRETYLKSLTNPSRTDGVLIISMPITDKQVKRFQKIGMPLVLIDSYHPDVRCINIDDVKGGRMATEHLLELGHTRIGFISDHLDNPLHFSSTNDRFEGYRQALSEKNIPINPEYIKHDFHGREEAKEMALELLNLDVSPTAIFAGSDTQAIGVLDAAKELGVPVPDRLSVIGYDDIRDAGYMNLTTIKQPLYELGVEGGKAIIDVLEEDRLEPLETILPVSLVVRGTTSKPGS